jgi:ribosomal protein S18 acetylase RimI-like enzyme
MIRFMKPSDVPQVRYIAEQAWRHTYSSFIPLSIQDQVLADAYSDEEMTYRFDNCVNFVFEEGQEVIGYAFFKGEGSTVHLESIYIHPSHQRKGIGQKLMDAAIMHFQPVHTVSLVVYKGNDRIAFYEKLGFQIEKEVQGNFFEHPITFIVMNKQYIEKA